MEKENQVNTASEWGGSKGKMRLGNPNPVTKTRTVLILHEDGCKEGFYLRVPTSQTKNGYKEVEHNAILFCDAFNTVQKCGKLPSQLYSMFIDQATKNDLQAEVIDQLKEEKERLIAEREQLLNFIDNASYFGETSYLEAKELLTKYQK